MTELVIEGRTVEVSDDFLSLSPQEQERTVEEIAATFTDAPSFPVMSNVNRGIADGIGGLVDFINPFDKPHALNPFPEGTGSLAKGMREGMEAMGVAVDQGQPQTLGQSFARGAGSAISTIVPAAKSIQALSSAPGLLGSMADDAARSLGTLGGATAEVAAGGGGGAGKYLAADAGASKPVQDIAAIAGGIATGGITALPQLMPSARIAGAVRRNIAPYTDAGGREIARQRMQSLAGGEDRARELAGRISGDEFGISPAQQTADPNMLGVEQLAGEQDAAIRARLDTGRVSSQQGGRDAVRALGGDPDAAKGFFEQRRNEYVADLEGRAREAVVAAREKMLTIGPQRKESDNALIMRDQIDASLSQALTEESRLWAAVPREATVDISETRAMVQRFKDSLPEAQKNDLPKAAAAVLDTPQVYGTEASVNDLHGLYSELRRISRAAMAGGDQNRNLKRVSNGVAEAVLKDLGAIDGTTPIGASINEARAFSAAVHETYDKGAVGRLLKRTLDGDTSIDPELSLARTVGRGGVEGAVASRQLGVATRGASDAPVQDHIRRMFSRSAIDPLGAFTEKSARRFIRDNDELLSRYPDLRQDIDAAVASQDSAASFGEHMARRIALVQDARGTGQAVIDGQTVKAVLSAKDPRTAAGRIANEARKDETGAALSGIKGAFADELIVKASSVSRGNDAFSGDKILEALNDPKMGSALRQVFDSGEMSRLRFIGQEMSKLKVQPADIGPSLSAAEPSKIIEYVARIAAARHGATLGGGSGGSLQTAQMASARVRELLNSLTADKASQIMADAVEDAELFRSLLLSGRAIKAGEFDNKVLPRLFPYLVGGAAVADDP